MIGSAVISVSIDATIRQWSLKADDLRRAKEDSQKKKSEDEEAPKKESMLTEEEERELAELMADDD